MVRPRRVIAEIINDLGALGTAAALMLLTVIGVAVMAIGASCVWSAEKLAASRWIRPAASGVLIGLFLLSLLVGCRSVPAPIDNEPAVWRPQNPVYPTP